jgi:hypothetical protein
LSQRLTHHLAQIREVTSAGLVFLAYFI